MELCTKSCIFLQKTFKIFPGGFAPDRNNMCKCNLHDGCHKHEILKYPEYFNGKATWEWNPKSFSLWFELRWQLVYVFVFSAVPHFIFSIHNHQSSDFSFWKKVQPQNEDLGIWSPRGGKLLLLLGNARMWVWGIFNVTKFSQY